MKIWSSLMFLKATPRFALLMHDVFWWASFRWRCCAGMISCMSSGFPLIMIMESFSLLFLQEVSRAENIDLWAAADADVQGIELFLSMSSFIYLHICVRGRACCMRRGWCDRLIDRCAVLTSAVVLFPSAVSFCSASCVSSLCLLQTTRSSARGCVLMPLLLLLTPLNLLENPFLTPPSSPQLYTLLKDEKTLIPNPSELLST